MQLHFANKHKRQATKSCLSCPSLIAHELQSKMPTESRAYRRAGKKIAGQGVQITVSHRLRLKGGKDKGGLVR